MKCSYHFHSSHSRAPALHLLQALPIFEIYRQKYPLNGVYIGDPKVFNLRENILCCVEWDLAVSGILFG
jgi:hypothetical protein